MLKNIVETTFQRATVASNYDELGVSLGKLRTQVNDLRMILREVVRELDQVRAQAAEVEQLRAEIAALRAGGFTAAPASVEAAPAVPVAAAAPAPAAAKPAAAPPKPAEARPAQPAPAAPISIAASVASVAAGTAPAEVVEEGGLHFAADGTPYWGPFDNESARARAAGKKLIIDQWECISCGTCVEQTDAVFVLPNDGKAVARVQEGPMDAIQDAIDACPVTCIHWTDKPEQFQQLNDEAGATLS